MHEDCVFCKIIAKELPADMEYEDEKFAVFKDIKPVAPLHLLCVPKKHIVSLSHATEADRGLLGDLLLTAQKVASGKRLPGYKIAMNVNREGGQVVDHMHLHLIGTIE
ncbi:MAG: HIT domain-containing protein [Candidatus Wildermuthbacteria bacterium]|nr:HIT domain-containing protein [Candidatus Wildermuthbacteria bacterium]